MGGRQIHGSDCLDDRRHRAGGPSCATMQQASFAVLSHVEPWDSLPLAYACSTAIARLSRKRRTMRSRSPRFPEIPAQSSHLLPAVINLACYAFGTRRRFNLFGSLKRGTGGRVKLTP